MNKYYRLLSEIAEEYHIRRGASEAAEEFKARLIYSALCRAGYASLFDAPADGEESVSLRHFKDRIDEFQKIYFELYPEARLPSDLSTTVYELYLSVGYIYHSQHRIAASIPRAVKSDGVIFLRGFDPSRSVRMSGAGFYMTSTAASFVDGVEEMFALPKKTLSETWHEIIRAATFRADNLPSGAEFLRMSPPFYHGYWKDQPDRDGAVSIARVGERGARLYYLYKFDGEKFLCSQQPTWRMIGVGCECLAARGTLPPIKFMVDGAIVRAELGYLPPPAERNLLKLYSWSREPSSDFKRTFAVDIFFALKNILERRGYAFEEE